MCSFLWFFITTHQKLQKAVYTNILALFQFFGSQIIALTIFFILCTCLFYIYLIHSNFSLKTSLGSVKERCLATSLTRLQMFAVMMTNKE